MTEKLFTGTLRINQPTNQHQLKESDDTFAMVLYIFYILYSLRFKSHEFYKCDIPRVSPLDKLKQYYRDTVKVSKHNVIIYDSNDVFGDKIRHTSVS